MNSHAARRAAAENGKGNGSATTTKGETEADEVARVRAGKPLIEPCEGALAGTGFGCDRR